MVHSNSINSSPIKNSDAYDHMLHFQNSIKQDAIKQGNVETLKNFLHKETLVNQPLPNGEMPLHYAVRLNQTEIVSLLLDQGADPEIKDFQNLNAIDHAVLIKNENLLACILGKKIGKDITEVQEQIKCTGSTTHINQLKSKIDSLLIVDPLKLIRLSQDAYYGYINKTDLQSDRINDFDNHGLAPIHYAILRQHINLFDQLIESGTKVDMVTREGNSLLHYAAISGSPEIINKLISLGVKINDQNSNGETALHYASAQENLSVVEKLIKAGASPYVLDYQGMSPLALIGTSAHQKDPLALSKSQIALFMATSLYWLAKIAPESSISDEARFGLMLLTTCTIAWSEFSFFVTNLEGEWKKMAAWLGMFGLTLVPGFSAGFSSLKIYQVATSTFKGFKDCWNNVGYRNGEVARNAIVHSVNTTNSIRRLFMHYYGDFQAFQSLKIHLPYWLKIVSRASNDDKNGYSEAIKTYHEFASKR